MIQALAKRLGTVVIAAAAMLGGVGTAQAASYGLSLDPTFGGIFPSLGWQASGQIELDGDCAALGNGTWAANGCSGLSFSSMSVGFYDATLGAPVPTILETFNVLTGPVSIQSFTVTGGLLTGIQAGFFANFTPTGAASSISGNGDYSFALYVGSGPVIENNQVTYGKLAYFKPSYESGPGCTIGLFGGNNQYCGVGENLGVGMITPVPEPQTYALMLAGLAAVGFMARRRRQA